MRPTRTGSNAGYLNGHSNADLLMLVVDFSNKIERELFERFLFPSPISIHTIEAALSALLFDEPVFLTNKITVLKSTTLHQFS